MQSYNPYLPLWEYIPDGEPHVFGDRVYLYGSHDGFGGNKYCMNDYVCWSANVHDLKEWRYEGIIYRSSQDPRMPDGNRQIWAPDVARGKDGRYYLYYCPDGDGEAIGVAVCNEPAGQYQFYGIVQDKKGQWIGKREGDIWQFDPGVFIDEDSKIYLYSGNGPKTEKDIGKTPKNSCVMELSDDMLAMMKQQLKEELVDVQDVLNSYASNLYDNMNDTSTVQGKVAKLYTILLSMPCRVAAGAAILILAVLTILLGYPRYRGLFSLGVEGLICGVIFAPGIGLMGNKVLSLLTDRILGRTIDVNLKAFLWMGCIAAGAGVVFLFAGLIVSWKDDR